MSDSDLLDRVSDLEQFDGRGGGSARLNPAAARACLAARDQLVALARANLESGPTPDGDPDEALMRALLGAFPDRLARRRADDPSRAVLVGGRGLRLDRACGVREGELFVALELDGGRGEARVRQASRVERDWVDGGQVRREVQAVFDPDRERVVWRRRELLGALVLSESEGGAGDASELEAVLARAAAEDVPRALGLERPEIAGWLARVAFLAEHLPELELPAFGAEDLERRLPQWVIGCRSFADLRRVALIPWLQGELTQAQRQALEREAPERLTVPSGSRIRLVYEPGRPPVLAARIQELFGMASTPRLARGRVAVLMHLLAPNGRPQQVTDDLASFWSDAYFEVRKELRRRYPKHAWPEDPTTAQARRRPGRR